MSTHEKMAEELASAAPLTAFPSGDPILAGAKFSESVLVEVDAALAAGRCDAGRLEIERHDARLTCLVRQGRPFLAGLLEGTSFSWIPLIDFPMRARQMEGVAWRLVPSDIALVMMIGVHFCRPPALQGSTRWIDLEQVLAGLADDGSDAAVALERDGRRNLLFVHRGAPARLFFADPVADPGDGGIAERLLLFAFAPGASEGRVEVFQELKLPTDEDAGRTLAELIEEAQPPPPVDLVVRLADGRKVVERPFLPPSVTIGRDPAADVFLDNLAVSRRHASLSWQRGRFVVRDLGSANGTKIDGRQVNSASIGLGDHIEIGKFSVALEAPAKAGGVSETMMLATPRSRRPAYLVGEERSWEAAGDLVIGRGSGVDVEARGMFVRRAHARLQRVAASTYEVQGFGGARVRINGIKVSSGRLTVGDRLAVGRSRFWLRWTPGDGRVSR